MTTTCAHAIADRVVDVTAFRALPHEVKTLK